MGTAQKAGSLTMRRWCPSSHWRRPKRCFKHLLRSSTIVIQSRYRLCETLRYPSVRFLLPYRNIPRDLSFATTNALLNPLPPFFPVSAKPDHKSSPNYVLMDPPRLCPPTRLSSHFNESAMRFCSPRLVAAPLPGACVYVHINDAPVIPCADSSLERIINPLYLFRTHMYVARRPSQTRVMP
jgi:hypothetical protein